MQKSGFFKYKNHAIQYFHDTSALIFAIYPLNESANLWSSAQYCHFTLGQKFKMVQLVNSEKLKICSKVSPNGKTIK